MKTPIIELKGINKSFTGHKVLDNIELTINAGERLCLVGENGCGKSTLIKIISGVYEADSGEILLNGKEYKKLIPTDSIKEGIQVIYQDFSIFPNLSVAENISLGNEIVEGKKLVSWPGMRKRAAKALKLIGVEMDLDIDVGKLSVAQKQIVAISRAILQDARLIIMDEPTTALTQKEIERLYEIIEGLSENGIAILFVSHKLDEVFKVCQRIAVLRSGNMVVDERLENFDRKKIVYYMTGQEIEVQPFVYKRISDEPILELESLTQKGSFDGVSLKLFPGEILGITGQLGSGRTELAKVMFGIGKVHFGKIKIKGEEKVFRNISDALACRIAYVPEDRLTEGLFMTRSLTDNVNAAVVDKMINRFGLISSVGMKLEAEKRIKELNVNAKTVEVLANTFSGGNQQRVVIGKWLASDPEILILNGPTVGVDVKSKSEIHKILRKLASEGFAVILISDDIGELMSTTNRILVMNNGRVIYEVETSNADEAVLSDKIILYVAKGETSTDERI